MACMPVNIRVVMLSGWFLGDRHVKDADKLIIARLKTQGAIINSGTLEHSYPFCPRSDTPLIYKVLPQSALLRLLLRIQWHGMSKDCGYAKSVVEPGSDCAERDVMGLGGAQLVREGDGHQGPAAGQQCPDLLGARLREGEALSQLARGAMHALDAHDANF